MAASLIAAGVLGFAPASAGIVEANPGRFICDTPAGRYDRTEIGRFASGNSITGRFRFLAGVGDRSRAAVAGYIFQFHNGESIEVHITASARFRRQLVVEVGVPGTGSRTVTRVPRSEPVEVTAGVTNGVLTVASSGRSRQIPVGARRLVRLEASCQSGRFEIEFTPQASTAPR